MEELTRVEVGCATVEPLAPLRVAVRLISSRGVFHALVVSPEARLEGVLSSRDIGARLLEVFEEEGLVEERALPRWLETPVRVVASKPPLVLSEDVGLRSALTAMWRSGIGVLPVVDENGHLVKCYEEVHAVYLLASSREPAAKYASRRVESAEPKDTLVDVLGRMVEEGFRHIVYPKAGSYYILSINDILRYVAEKPSEHSLLDYAEKVARPAVMLPSDATLGEAAQLISLVPERAVLIRSEGGGLAGILTARDLVRVVAESGA